MKNKFFLMILESILFCGLFYFFVMNINSKTTSGISISLQNSLYVDVYTFLVILIPYMIGVFSGLVYSGILGKKYKDQIEFYARKNEKLAVQNEIDTDDKEALQRKIASLEIALENALKNQN